MWKRVEHAYLTQACLILARDQQGVDTSLLLGVGEVVIFDQHRGNAPKTKDSAVVRTSANGA